MKIVIFGTGVIYNRNIRKLEGQEIIALVDNDVRKLGEKIDGIEIVSPLKIRELKFDKIILMSIYAGKMKKQLINEMGVEADKIINYDEFIGSINRYKIITYIAPQATKPDNPEYKKILIITTDLGYNGGTLAAIYAARALQGKKYKVFLVAPDGDDTLINEISKQGITIFIYSNLNYASWEELYWLENFAFIIINTLQMFNCINTVSGHKPYFFWIHEPNEIYEILIENHPKLIELDINKIPIYAVSKIAENNLKSNFSAVSKDPLLNTLLLGIPDESQNNSNSVFENKEKAKKIFAVIGAINRIKGQDILLRAIEDLKMTKRIDYEIWFIGAFNQNTEFGSVILNMAKKIPNIIFTGVLTREEIAKVYEKIDVVVCPSREETLSIVAIETLMHRKLCIISESIGMAEYIKDGYNGLVFETENAEALKEKIQWVFNNPERLGMIQENGRYTYEKYFSMEYFSNNLENIIKGLIEMHH